MEIFKKRTTKIISKNTPTKIMSLILAASLAASIVPSTNCGMFDFIRRNKQAFCMAGYSLLALTSAISFASNGNDKSNKSMYLGTLGGFLLTVGKFDSVINGLKAFTSGSKYKNYNLIAKLFIFQHAIERAFGIFGSIKKILFGAGITDDNDDEDDDLD